MDKSKRWATALKLSALFVYASIIIVPFFWLISSALKSDAQFYAIPPVWLPDAPRWGNFATVLIEQEYWRYIFNSVWLGVVIVILSVTSSAFVAYGFARYNFPGKKVIFVVLLGTMMLPAQVTLLPTFILYREIGWLNTYLPLIAPHLFGSAFVVFLLRQFFVSIPKEMDEAAKLDGCGPIRTWALVILPQAKPALITSGLFVFMWVYKDVLAPLIYLGNRSQYTISVALLFFTSPTRDDYPLQFAGVALALIPTIIFYLISMRFTDRGIHIASLK